MIIFISALLINAFGKRAIRDDVWGLTALLGVAELIIDLLVFIMVFSR